MHAATRVRTDATLRNALLGDALLARTDCTVPLRSAFTRNGTIAENGDGTIVICAKPDNPCRCEIRMKLYGALNMPRKKKGFAKASKKRIAISRKLRLKKIKW